MSYFVLISCQIDNGTVPMNQQIVRGLQGLGFSQNIKGVLGMTALPQYTHVGVFNGENVIKIREDLFEKVMAVFKSSGAKGSVFMTVSQTWTWASRAI